MKSYKVQRFARLAIYAVILFALRLFWVREYIITNGVETDDICQVYFGGISVDMSSDIFSVAVYMMMIIIEVIMVQTDTIPEVFHNMDILLCRAGSRGRLYMYMLTNVCGHALTIISVNYLLFLAAERAAFLPEQLLYVISELELVLALDLIYILLYSAIRNDICYVAVIALFVIPIMTVGFLRLYGEASWEHGKYYFPLTLIYNYMHPYSYTYTAVDYTVSTHVFSAAFAGGWFYPAYELAVLLVLAEAAGVVFVKRRNVVCA